MSWFSPSCVTIQFLYCDKGQRYNSAIRQQRAQHSNSARNTTLLYCPARARHGAQCPRHGFWVTIQILYPDREVTLWVAIQRAAALRYGVRHSLRHDLCSLLHGRRGATTRRPVRHDTAPSARRVRCLGPLGVHPVHST